MCCLPCMSYNKVADDSWQKVKNNVYCGLCQANSLLFGTWELINETNQAAFLKQMGGITEETMDTFLHKKQIIQLNPTCNESIWLYRFEAETGEITNMNINFGIEKHELTPFRVPARATYLREGKHKLTVHYVMYDGRHAKATREVKWWRPNRLVTEIVLDNVISSARIYRRINTV